MSDAPKVEPIPITDEDLTAEGLQRYHAGHFVARAIARVRADAAEIKRLREALGEAERCLEYYRSGHNDAGQRAHFALAALRAAKGAKT